VKRSEVKRSEVVLHYRVGIAQDYVATSYRLDGPGSFPGSIFMLFSSVSAVFSDVHVLVLYCENSCVVLYCFLVECMVFVNTATGHKPSCS
jgi:hypothetical protein